MVLGLFRRNKPRPTVMAVYGDIVAASRDPVLYRELGVPDTLMGRFESLALHAGLVLMRLKTMPPPADSLSQELVDMVFAELDAALREVGVGDVSVPKKIKKLAQAFYGRIQAYDVALQPEAGALDLEAALARNMMEKPDEPARAAALARHVRRLWAALSQIDPEAFVAGEAFSRAGKALK